MDFMNRGNRPGQQNTQSPDNGLGSAAPKPPAHKPGKLKNPSKLIKAGYMLFLVAIAVLILAMLFSVVFAKDNKYQEESYIKDDRLQAVFLNGGQVYFGKITDLNTKYLSMNKIYYLRVNQQVQPDRQNEAAKSNDVSLVKLGCELHGPEDSMVINREQVIFWENLKTDGQVAKAVEEYIKANPDGQKCTTNQQTDNSSGTGSNASNNSSNTPAANTESLTPNQ